MALGYLVEDGGGSTPGVQPFTINKILPSASGDSVAVYLFNAIFDTTNFTKLSIGYMHFYSGQCIIYDENTGTQIASLANGQTLSNLDISSYTSIRIYYSTFRSTTPNDMYVGNVVFA